jgi:hypothetical protein
VENMTNDLKSLKKFCENILNLNQNIFFIIISDSDGKLVFKTGKENGDMGLENQTADFYSKISMITWARNQVPESFGNFISALINYNNITILDAGLTSDWLISVYMNPGIEEKSISTIKRLISLFGE